MRNIFFGIIDIIFPIECLGCGKEGKWICEECATKIPLNSATHCLECRTKTAHGEFCPTCRNKYALDGVFIATDYKNELVKKAIKTFKYKFVHEISQELGKLLALFILEQKKKENLNSWLEIKDSQYKNSALKNLDKILVVPVPLHAKRLKWRGFNQSEKLALEFAGYFKLPLNRSGLARIKYAKPQANLSPRERKQNLADSFFWQENKLNGLNVLLVDDVVTTGSTFEECAKALKVAGAEQVWGLAVAKG